MFIELTVIETIDRLGRKWKANAVKMQCDYCQCIFVRKQLKRDLIRVRNYCSKSCSDNSKKDEGASALAFQKTCLEHFGTTSPAQNKEIYDKVKLTNLERYGSTCSLNNEEIKDKIRQDCIEQHNVNWPSQLAITTEKRKITNMKKYGVTNPMVAPQIMELYDYDEILQKKIATMKKNKTFGRVISKPEKRFYELLLKEFDKNDIFQQSKIENKRWCIDFYIKSINTWIQVDGIYWHGLNRPIEEIRKLQNKQAIAICNIWNSDRQQEIWFKEQNLHLIRITDTIINNLDVLPKDLTTIAHFSC